MNIFFKRVLLLSIILMLASGSVFAGGGGGGGGGDDDVTCNCSGSQTKVCSDIGYCYPSGDGHYYIIGNETKNCSDGSTEYYSFSNRKETCACDSDGETIYSTWTNSSCKYL